MRARGLFVSAVLCLAAYLTGPTPGACQDLMDLVPPDAAAMVLVDWDPESESVRRLAEVEELQPGSRALFREGIERMLRGAGVNLDLSEDLFRAFGPRLAVVVMPPPQGSSVPEALLLAEVQDPDRAERAVHRVLGVMDRTASVDRIERGDAVIGTWRTADNRPRFTYTLRGGRVLATSLSERLTTRLLEGGTPPAGPLRTVMEMAPEGILRFAVAQAILDPRNPQSTGGIAGSVRFGERGIEKTLVAEIEETSIARIVEAVGALPDASTEALRPVPDGSIAAAVVGRPSAILREVQRVLGPGNPLEAFQTMVPRLVNVLESDVAVALRTALPRPSWLVSLAAQDAETLEEHWSAIDQAIASLGIAKFQETRYRGHTLRLIQQPEAKTPGPMVVATVDRYLLAAADRRTVEEAIDVIEGRERSLLESDSFRHAFEGAVESPKLFVYSDPSLLTGAGMVLSQIALLGLPTGQRLAEALQAFESVSVSATVSGKRAQARVLIGLTDGKLPPASLVALAALPAVVAGVTLQRVQQPREAEHLATCAANLRALHRAAAQYQQDHGGRLPPAGKWRSELLPYLEGKAEYFRCPADPLNHPSSYAMNRNLSGRAPSGLAAWDRTVLFYETTSTHEHPADTGQSLPRPGRHQEARNNYAFLDGKVIDRPEANPQWWTPIPKRTPAAGAGPRPGTPRGGARSLPRGRP